MKTINACLVILITILGFTTSFDFASIKEIQSLKQNSFASSLIETISLSLASNKDDAASDVLSMLEDLNSQLKNDQVTDDNTFTAKDGEFTAHINKLSEEITKLTDEIAALEARIQELTGLIAQAELNIVSFTERIGSLTLSLANLEEKLVEDTKYYTDKANGLAELNVKLLLVNSKLAELVGSASGENIYSHIDQTESEKRDIAFKQENTVATTSFIQLTKKIPVISNLLQMTLQADQKALQKLMDIISKFADQALQEKADAERKLIEAQETHDALKKQMEDEVKLNTAARAKQEENKKNYETEKSEKEIEKAEKEARKEALEKEREINQDLQKQLGDTYNKEKSERAEEIKVVGTLPD